jgi:Fe-S cluster biosynthesis and repair protein YggX
MNIKKKRFYIASCLFLHKDASGKKAGLLPETPGESVFKTHKVSKYKY